MQRWIERTRLDAEAVRRFCANGLANAVAVLRTPLKGLQDEHVERSLEKLDAVRVWFFLWHVGQRITSKAVDCLLLCCATTLKTRNSVAELDTAALLFIGFGRF